tara:strand:- start:236 stop:481 length:246 start_codon:yes stop_codon:yes gene_type:complete
LLGKGLLISRPWDYIYFNKKGKTMSKTSNLYDQIKNQFDTFESEHEKNMNGNKAAGSRARKAIGEVKKLVTDYRKASVAGE